MVAEHPVNADGLTVKQILAVDAIVSGNSMKQAAITAGVTPRTLLTWRSNPDFIAVLNRKLQEVTDMSGTQGVGLVPECLEVLKTIMKSTTAEDKDRIRAATVIMSSAAAFREQRELEIYVTRMEQQLMLLAGATTNKSAANFHRMRSAAADSPEAE